MFFRLFQRKGLYPPPPGESDIMGLEAAGLIEPLAIPMSDKWKPKSKVMALLPGGGYAELVAVKYVSLIINPVSIRLQLFFFQRQPHNATACEYDLDQRWSNSGSLAHCLSAVIFSW